MSSSGSWKTAKTINTRSEELMRGLVLRLVCGAGERLTVERRFPPRPYASLVKKFENFSW